MPTNAEIISLYPIAQYLAANDLPRGGLYDKGVNGQLPQKIRNIGDSIKWIYDADPTDDTLTATCNYLWTLCGIYGQKAQVVTQSAGSVSPVTPISSSVNRIDFIVSASSYMVTGQSTKTITEFIGREINFVRGSIPQSTVSSEPSYITWNKLNGELVVSPALAEGELISIIPS